MNTLSGSPADRPSTARAPASASGRGRILVWDAPVRVVHWLLVLCFAGAWLTAESERWRLVHVTLGLTMAALVAFRVLWGVVGTRHARFGSFVRGPGAVLGYLRGWLRGTPERHVGHNPAGGLAIVALLALAAGVCTTGWIAYDVVASHALEEFHEGMATAMAALVGLHVGAVVVTGWRHRENLVAAMWHGRKRGPAVQQAPRAWRPLGLLILAAVIGFWAWQWQHPPAMDATAQGAAAAGRAHDDDD